MCVSVCLCARSGQLLVLSGVDVYPSKTLVWQVRRAGLNGG